LTLADFLDFGLFHDALETLETHVFDQLGQELAVFSQLEQDLVVVWCADLGAFLEDFFCIMEQFSCTFGHVLFSIRLIINLTLQSTLLQGVMHQRVSLTLMGMIIKAMDILTLLHEGLTVVKGDGFQRRGLGVLGRVELRVLFGE
jgi:hypothetical protein